MEKDFQSSGDSVASSHYLKQLNKLSHKIAKPPLAAPHSIIRKSPPPLPLPPSLDQSSQPQLHPLPLPLPQTHPPHQPQPPVYNINKSDFRDVVQKLTGSPAHPAPPGAPPNQPPPTLVQSAKQPSLRMQRIRPPRLEHIVTRPPALMAPPDHLQFFHPLVGNSSSSLPPSSTPLSPLPPLPTVHAAAESPISAYMRHIKSSGPSNPTPSRWNNPFPSPLSSQQHNSTAEQLLPTSGGYPPPPFSQLPQFSCMSPLSAARAYAASFPLLSPPALPVSPTVPDHNPNWRGA